MKQLILCLALLCLALCSCAQSQQSGKPLQVGDTIPHIILTDVVNFPVSEIQLSSYKGKLLILDFWATWCNSCVRTFPKLDSLQQKFSGSVQFVLINHLARTGNTKEQVVNFFYTHQKLASSLRKIPVCIDTSQRLFSLFPHTFIPHYIWVGPAGNIIAITGYKELSVTNIKDALKDNTLQLPVKRE